MYGVSPTKGVSDRDQKVSVLAGLGPEDHAEQEDDGA